MKLTVDPLGRFSFAYFAFFLSSLLSAAAPSDSDDFAKIPELQGCARAISRSPLQPLSGQMPQCLVYHLNLNSDVVALFGGAHLALGDTQTKLMLWLHGTKLAHHQIYMLTDGTHCHLRWLHSYMWSSNRKGVWTSPISRRSPNEIRVYQVRTLLTLGLRLTKLQLPSLLRSKAVRCHELWGFTDQLLCLVFSNRCV